MSAWLTLSARLWRRFRATRTCVPPLRAAAVTCTQARRGVTRAPARAARVAAAAGSASSRPPAGAQPLARAAARRVIGACVCGAARARAASSSLAPPVTARTRVRAHTHTGGGAARPEVGAHVVAARRRLACSRHAQRARVLGLPGSRDACSMGSFAGVCGSLGACPVSAHPWVWSKQEFDRLPAQLQWLCATMAAAGPGARACARAETASVGGGNAGASLHSGRIARSATARACERACHSSSMRVRACVS